MPRIQHKTDIQDDCLSLAAQRRKTSIQREIMIYMTIFSKIRIEKPTVASSLPINARGSYSDVLPSLTFVARRSPLLTALPFSTLSTCKCLCVERFCSKSPGFVGSVLVSAFASDRSCSYRPIHSLCRLLLLVSLKPTLVFDSRHNKQICQYMGR